MNERSFIGLDDVPSKMYRNYGNIKPELNSVEEIRLKESTMGKHLERYEIPSQEFNQFLSERFGYNIEGFRKLYLSKHIENMTGKNVFEDEISGIMSVHPIPEKVSTYFTEVNGIFELMFKYEGLKKFVEAQSCSGPLPLHNDRISNFSIIRAKFSNLTSKPENLEKLQEEKVLGYYFSDEKFRFIISSSNQLDLTVIYEEL